MFIYLFVLVFIFSYLYPTEKKCLKEGKRFRKKDFEYESEEDEIDPEEGIAYPLAYPPHLPPHYSAIVPPLPPIFLIILIP